MRLIKKDLDQKCLLFVMEGMRLDEHEKVDPGEFEKRWRLKVNNVEVAVIGPKGFYSTKSHYINPKYILSLFDIAKRDNYV